MRAIYLYLIGGIVVVPKGHRIRVVASAIFMGHNDYEEYYELEKIHGDNQNMRATKISFKDSKGQIVKYDIPKRIFIGANFTIYAIRGEGELREQ